MVILNACREVSAPLGRVWDIVADVVRHINAVNNISKNGNTIEREVIVPFRNSKSRQTVVINPKRSGLKIVVADGAYDSKENFRYLYDNNIEAAIKVRKNSSYRFMGCNPRRKVVIQQLKNLEKWKSSVSYGQRWIAESVFSCMKRMFGGYVSAKEDFQT